jgi:hypothetical protein
MCVSQTKQVIKGREKQHTSMDHCIISQGDLPSLQATAKALCASEAGVVRLARVRMQRVAACCHNDCPVGRGKFVTTMGLEVCHTLALSRPTRSCSAWTALCHVAMTASVLFVWFQVVQSKMMEADRSH